ncbi:hypothetical protein FOG51_00786 [Hanseniaspora uvarum]|nr:hypothetical protein FOG51_00786 [Hanseniaspora uvarum]KAF0278583.1 hypothetical protein FOG50_00566 [Hanseniaspora uvarum]KKA02737.1 RHO GTPase-activating protein HuRGD1 [Hanseniaspora uvarum DSM 2768]
MSVANPTIDTKEDVASINVGTNNGSNQNISSAGILERPEINKFLNESDIATNTLLTKFKTSIIICEEFSKIIKRKYSLESNYNDEFIKSSKNYFTGQDGNSSFSATLNACIKDVLKYDNKLIQVKQSYIKALVKMYDELSALLLTMTKLRKQTKEKIKKLEKDVSDSIHQAEKAKNKYDSLCQDYTKLKKGDPTKTKLTIRGSKTLPEQEEDLRKKIDMADLDYKQKVDLSTTLRNKFLSIERPQIVKNLKDMILEMDVALSIQIQKYAIWNENYFLNSGIVICPLNDMEKSMKTTTNSINVEYDLYNYLNKYVLNKNKSSMVNKNLIPVQYKKSPYIGGSKNTPNTSAGSAISNPVSGSFVYNSGVGGIPDTNSITATPSNNNFSIAPMKNTNPFVKKHQQSSQMQSPNLNSFHQGNATSNSEAETINNPRGGSVNSYKTLDPVGSPSIPQQSATPAPPSSIIESIVHTEADSKNAANMNGENGELAASFKTFGISLSQLILLEQDSLLPKFVKQCIHVIDKYGLDIEGIYRKSSNVLELQKYIKLINQDPSNYALLLPPRSSENGHGVEEHVILVSNLLKHFFKNLPVKFISSSFLSEFQTYIAIPSNSESNIVMKRNYMHGIVYKLKDEQYWVLRALLFHFKRILDNSNVNRMSLKAMCIIWGPILISSPSGDDLNSNQNEFGDSNLSLDNSNEYMKDVQFQIKVMEGLFDVAEQAFEPE